MILPEKLALQLVCMWVHRPPECQESFGYLISSFIKDNPSIQTKEELEEILIASKRITQKIAVQYSSDMYLHLTHKTFLSALDNFINCLN